MSPLTFPDGTVTTDRPGPGHNPYGIPWTDVSRWEPLFTQGAGEAHVPPQLIAAMAVVESDANHTWPSGPNQGQVIQVDDGFGDGPSVGIMQVKPQLFPNVLPGVDAFMPEGNIRFGARLMQVFIDETGSWPEAIRLKYHPGVSPNGTTPQMYVDAVTSLMNEMGLTGVDLISCPASPPPPFDGETKVINGVTFHPAQQTVQSKINGLRARQFANTQACLTREPLHTGERVDVLYWVHGEQFQNENRWWVAVDGSRIWSGGTAESPSQAVIDIPDGGTLNDAMRAAGMCISQEPFDPFSHGICDCYDFAIPVGTPIPALAGGRVIGAKMISESQTGDQDFVYRPGKVTVQAADGLGNHVYAHLSVINVSVGDEVGVGTLLGRSGDRNGPHLHWQLDGGSSPAGLNSTQILRMMGLDVDTYPRC
jgi:hypothetical protein